MLDHTAPRLLRDKLDRAMLGKDADVVTDIGNVLVRGNGELLRAAHFFRFDVEPEQPFPQRVLKEEHQRLLSTGWFLPAGHCRFPQDDWTAELPGRVGASSMSVSTRSRRCPISM